MHVASLGPRNIYKIFAGGNHSWVVLDDIIPVREKYRPPSPMADKEPSLSHSPSSKTKEKSRKVSESRQSFSGVNEKVI